MKPTKVTHIGSTKFYGTFAHMNLLDTLARKIVLTIGCVTQPDSALFAGYAPDEMRRIKQDLDTLHLEKIAAADEVLVLNLTGYIGQSTLHELCYAYNQQKRIRWLEEWPIYCPRCRCEGPEATHFFHNALSMAEMNILLASEETHAYLPGQLVEWYGRIVPVIRLAYGALALQVDLDCPTCRDHGGTYYAVAGDDGAFRQLLTLEEEYLADLRNADEASSGTLCLACRQNMVPDGLMQLVALHRGER